MTTPTTTTQDDARLSAIGEDGAHCILCERTWRGEPLLWHALVISATEPVVTCEQDEDDEDDHDDGSRWHGFEVHNHRAVLLVTALVCPPCITERGLEAAVTAALRRAMRVDQGAN